MRRFGVFCAVLSVVVSADTLFDYNGELWKREIDIVDFAKMDMKATWEEWKKDFERTYVTLEEEMSRFTIFIENLQYIARWNSDVMNDARLRPNQFADMTLEEINQKMHGRNDAHRYNFPKLSHLRSAEHLEANPTSVDWQQAGYVTPIKNQGNCGSCWAFSAVGSTECIFAKNGGALTSLSEQQVVDCCHAGGSAGCSGGDEDAAIGWIAKNGGLCSESEYSYTGKDGTCKTCSKQYNPIKGDAMVTADDESALETAVATQGCVSVAVDASQAAFSYYSSGILTGNCGTSLDHAIVVVGYGVESGQEYWRVKNSWGTSWGENGYIRICKNCNKNGNKGECGINMDCSYPTV